MPARTPKPNMDIIKERLRAAMESAKGGENERY